MTRGGRVDLNGSVASMTSTARLAAQIAAMRSRRSWSSWLMCIMRAGRLILSNPSRFDGASRRWC